MNIEQMRQALIALYPGRRWHEKVAKMSESQVQAIYLRKKREGSL